MMRSGASKVPEERRWTRNSKNNGKPRLPRRELLCCGASPLRPRPQSTSVTRMPFQGYLMYFVKWTVWFPIRSIFITFFQRPLRVE
jgi:hypothetical protein